MIKIGVKKLHNSKQNCVNQIKIGNFRDYYEVKKLRTAWSQTRGCQIGERVTAVPELQLVKSMNRFVYLTFKTIYLSYLTTFDVYILMF